MLTILRIYYECIRDPIDATRRIITLQRELSRALDELRIERRRRIQAEARGEE